jgi:nucleoside-diphosphate-sugar epimerase
MAKAGTVFVTGATGFIGSAAVAALVDAGWMVTCSARAPKAHLAHNYKMLDLAQPESLLELATEEPFDAIVHLGAQIGWNGASETDMYAPNVLSTGCLAYLANLWGSRLIFASAAIVHGVMTEAITTDSPVCTDTAYAKTKYLGEQLLASSGVDYCALRIAGVFGMNGPSHLGLNRAIAGAIKGEAPIQMGSGVTKRNYVYVNDVAEAIVHALRESLQGVHLLAGHEVLSMNEMLKQVCEILAPSLQPVIIEGTQARDQVITPSAALPRTRDFRNALIDMRRENRL